MYEAVTDKGSKQALDTRAYIPTLYLIAIHKYSNIGTVIRGANPPYLPSVAFIGKWQRPELSADCESES